MVLLNIRTYCLLISKMYIYRYSCLKLSGYRKFDEMCTWYASDRIIATNSESIRNVQLKDN